MCALELTKSVDITNQFVTPDRIVASKINKNVSTLKLSTENHPFILGSYIGNIL